MAWAKRTTGFSGADLAGLINEAGLSLWWKQHHVQCFIFWHYRLTGETRECSLLCFFDQLTFLLWCEKAAMAAAREGPFQCKHWAGGMIPDIQTAGWLVVQIRNCWIYEQVLLLFVSDIFRWIFRSLIFDFFCPCTGMTSDLFEMWQCGFVWNHSTEIRKLFHFGRWLITRPSLAFRQGLKHSLLVTCSLLVRRQMIFDDVVKDWCLSKLFQKVESFV